MERTNKMDVVFCVIGGLIIGYSCQRLFDAQERSNKNYIILGCGIIVGLVGNLFEF